MYTDNCSNTGVSAEGFLVVLVPESAMSERTVEFLEAMSARVRKTLSGKFSHQDRGLRES